MRRRLYFLLPDVDSARRTADDLLLARIEDRHMNVLARRGTDLGELREAGYALKSDLLHGAGVGGDALLICGTGFLGAFTTFSTMAVETVMLCKDGHALLGIVYLCVSVTTGLVCCYLGIVLARLLPFGRAPEPL